MPKNLIGKKKSVSQLLETMKVPKLESIPERINPMLAKFIDAPFNKKNWIFELKFDGYRVMAFLKDQVYLFSRNYLIFNDRFPAIVAELNDFSMTAVLDGEVVVLDENGRPDFKRLQNYLKTGHGDPILFIFDLLYYENYDLRNLPLLTRKEVLKKILPESGHIRYAEHIEEQGELFFKKIVELGIEGVVAKKADSLYREGMRTDDWLKIKSYQTQEAIIVGYTQPRRSRSHIGSLILAVYDAGQLVFIGHSGGGFTERELRELKERLDKLQIGKSAFKVAPITNTKPTWVKPELVCEMKFTEWTPDGVMRHPIFVGLREDKNPAEVGRELPKPKKEVVENFEMRFTHKEKIYWPEDGYTKGDMIDYYEQVSSYILPFLVDRPQSLNRFPGGLSTGGFYQKNLVAHPNWINTIKLYSESDDKFVNYLVCTDQRSLFYMANLGCIEMNPWNSRVGHLEHPDYLILDLDPVGVSFKEVVKVALATYEILRILDITAFCKTSGETGLHIFIPTAAKYNYEQVREFAKLINVLVLNRVPESTSLERLPEKRQHKVYLDYLQNRKGQTLACAYSLRPQLGAPVSTPLKWEEVNNQLNPKAYNIKNTIKRIKNVGDLWSGTLGQGVDIQKAMERLEFFQKKGKL